MSFKKAIFKLTRHILINYIEHKQLNKIFKEKFDFLSANSQSCFAVAEMYLSFFRNSALLENFAHRFLIDKLEEKRIKRGELYHHDKLLIFNY